VAPSVPGDQAGAGAWPPRAGGTVGAGTPAWSRGGLVTTGPAPAGWARGLGLAAVLVGTRAPAAWRPGWVLVGAGVGRVVAGAAVVGGGLVVGGLVAGGLVVGGRVVTGPGRSIRPLAPAPVALASTM